MCDSYDTETLFSMSLKIAMVQKALYIGSQYNMSTRL